MKHSWYLVLLLLPLAAKSQQSAPLVINEHIENAKTAAHVHVPGTRLYLIPPAGFTASKKYAGFQKENSNGDGIVVFDTIKENYFENYLTTFISRIEKSGGKILIQKPVIVQGYAGRFLTIKISHKLQTHVLLFGSKKICVQLFAPFLSCCKQYSDEMLQSINTIWYDKQTVVHPYDTAGFSVNDRLSIYKYFAYDSASNSFAFTLDGKRDSLDGSLPVVIISRLPAFTETNAEEMALLSDKLIASKYQLVNLEKRNVVTQKINNATGYQVETYGKMDGIHELVYQCIITDGRNTFLFRGISKTDLENSLWEFKKLAATFRISE
ncbi:MAG: hypothetical protein V4722_17155 [Bacteroidota bacterium]